MNVGCREWFRSTLHAGRAYAMQCSAFLSLPFSICACKSLVRTSGLCFATLIASPGVTYPKYALRMDPEALPQRAANPRRSRTQDSRASKISKRSSSDDQETTSDNKLSDLSVYRSNAEENQQFECELLHGR